MLARRGALALLVVACRAPPSTDDRPAAASLEPPAVMPHRAPQTRLGDVVQQNAECESCHREIADEWQASLHREAFTSREFQSAFRSEPLAFCRECHAAESPRTADPRTEALGIACVTCHVPEGDVVLAAPREGPIAAPHPVRREPAFASPAACAGCHEFEFPDRRPVPERMQTTIAEHARSSARDRSCAECHMPRAADGHRTHAFAASRDAAWMRSVVAITATRPSPERVEFTLDLDEDAVGHALPTGDLFRQIAVEALSTRRALRPIARRQTLARHWRMLREGGLTAQTLVRDDRLGVADDPVHVTVELDPADFARPIRWRVRYERVQSFTAQRDDAALVVGGFNLADGVLDTPPGTVAPETNLAVGGV
ncbi:MAG: cytochrome c3 family protein [Nannocystaceae bacterium]